MATQQIKDILNTEIPKPSFVLSPSVPAPLPSGVTHSRNGADNVARSLDPYSGKFEHVPEDTPRIYGDDQSLLVEAASRTNHVLDAANPSTWASSGVTFNDITSLHADEGSNANVDAKEVVSSGSTADNIFTSAGTFSGNTEVAEFYMEQGTSDKILWAVRNSTSGNLVAAVNYEWSTDSTNVIIGSAADVKVRTISTNGPNGNEIGRFLIRYSGGNSANVSSEARQVQINPDRNGNSNSVLFHHAQLEEAPNASSPIVTSGSAKTRAGDDYTIFSGGQPPWWNPNEGTFLVRFTPRVYEDDGATRILAQSTDERFLFYDYNKNKVGAFDGTNAAEVDNVVSPFSETTAAVSFTSSEIRASANGSSTTSPHNGNLFNVSKLFVGQKDDLIFDLGKIIYIPRALPESTLNILTT